MRKLLTISAALLLSACTSSQLHSDALSKIETPSKIDVSSKFEDIKHNDIALRAFLQAMPKGGDLHNHLSGAVYAESWIAWAEEDGLCLDKAALRVHFPTKDGCGENTTVKAALSRNQALRNQLIDNMSMRDFTAGEGWSGHDQFFRTFSVFTALPSRAGDMLAEASNRAGLQNIAYLELMVTKGLFDRILPLVGEIALSGDAEQDYDTIMNSAFGKQLPDILRQTKNEIDLAEARKTEILDCNTNSPQPGCKVIIRYLSQNVRTLPSSAVLAHMIFSWHLLEQDSRFVGINLVAPEDDYIALRDYDEHMQHIDYLYKTLGPRNVSLHAGELWLGLVQPKELRFHINDAIKVGRAKRIGHGTDIVFENNYQDLLKHMARENILVEISLTSSEVILGVKGSAHPYFLYRDAGVPIAFSTDDEGVSRIDLTHELMKAVKDLGVSYSELKQSQFDSLKYAFVDDTTKANMIKQMEKRFVEFELSYF
jgi:adenosine deaminase